MFQVDEREPNLILPSSQSVQVMDAEEDKEALYGLDFPTWLPFAAKTYNISPNIDDYILVVAPICPSDIPNRNGIAFPLRELTTFQPPPINRMSYKAWTGCPMHLEHANQVHTDAYGVVLDASLHKISGYGDGKLWKVMGLFAIDKTKYPEMADKIARGEINTYSMGAYVDYFTCSYCDSKVGEHSHCEHVRDQTVINWKEYRDYDSSRHIAFLNAHGISPIEVSIVASPAWTTALSDTILTRGISR